MKDFIEKLLNMIRMRSLRARIFVIILVVGVIPAVMMRYAIVSNYEERAVDRRVRAVQNQLRIVANHLISNNYINSLGGVSGRSEESRKIASAELEMLSNIYEGRVMIIGGNYKVLEDTYGVSTGKTIISEEVIRCFRGETTSYYDADHGYIEMTTPIKDTTGEGENARILGVILTSISDDSIVSMMEVLNRNSQLLVWLIVLVIFVLAVALSYFLTKPLQRVSDAIAAFKAGYTNDPISVPDYAETVHIVDAFNSLQTRMRVLDKSREEFVANVSHELKTPMTSMKVLADSLLDQPGAPVEIYREFLQDIGEEIDRENRIITDLLALVKLDRSGSEMHVAMLDIAVLAELVLKRLRPLARKKDVELVLESNREISAEVDEVKLTLLLTNLVENAIKYNMEHGWVRVVLDADHQSFTIKVSDSGVGIPQDSMEHIYERFYRVDKSHSREIGGTGLGLAIARNVVLAHRGSIEVESKEGEGTTFTVRIPLTYQAPKGRND